MRGISKPLTLLCITFSLVVSAQGDLNKTSGFVESFGEVISGEIVVNQTKNTITVKQNGMITLLHAKNVQKIVAVENGREQVYYTGAFGMNKSAIFKALSDGGMPLLYREGVKFSEFDEIVYDPFFFIKDNQIFSLGNSKKEIYEIFDGHFQKDMEAFSKENKIDFKSIEGLTALFNHYNAIAMMAAN